MSKSKSAFIYLIIANSIWGIAAPIFKWSLATIHPFTIAFLRFAFAALLIALIAHPRQLKIKLKHLPLFILAGIFGIGVNIGAFFVGIQHTESINSPIISSSGPIFLILGSMLFLKEKPTRHMLMGNLIGLTGVLLIVLEPMLHSSPSSALYGNLLLILATIGSIVGTIVIKDLAKWYNAFTLSFWTFLIGSITFVPFFLQEYHQYGLLPQLQFPGLTGVIFGALFPSLTAYTLFYWSLKYVLASQTSVFTYIDPVAAIIVAAPLVHEYPTPIFVLGSILVFLGVYVAERRNTVHSLHHFLAKR